MGQAQWLKPIILTVLEEDICWIVVQSQAWEKVLRNPISAKSWAQWCAAFILAVLGCINRTIVAQADPILKITNPKNKKAGLW
jgi:hypothetical protein